MKNIGLLFVISFIFFLTGQILWMLALIFEDPLFGIYNLEEWIINIFFTLYAIAGLIGSIKLYQLKK